jgi:hypothetical protein
VISFGSEYKKDANLAGLVAKLKDLNKTLAYIDFSLHMVKTILMSDQGYRLLSSERHILGKRQRYTYRVLETIQMKLILLCIWVEPAALDSTKTALKFKYGI